MDLSILIALTISAALGVFLFRKIKENKRLWIDRDNLLSGNAGLSREIKRLNEELDRYKAGALKILLTQPERRILLNALESPHYKARIQEPKTRRYIRIIYNTLRRKIQDSIKE